MGADELQKKVGGFTALICCLIIATCYLVVALSEDVVMSARGLPCHTTSWMGRAVRRPGDFFKNILTIC
jgi:hypothetical protein